MADDGVLNIGTRVNLGPLQSGMAQAQSTVKSTLSQMAGDSSVWAKVMADGPVKASEAFKRYEEEVRRAQAATESFARTQERTTSAYLAASSELRVLEGNLQGSTRAAGAFLAALPGVGAAMAVAFPVAGAIALAEILYRSVEAVNKWKDALSTLGATEQATHDQMVKNAEDELRHSTMLVKADFDLAIAKASTPIEKDQLRVQLESTLVSLGEKRVSQLQAAKQQLLEYAATQQKIADAEAKYASAFAGGGASGQSGYGSIIPGFLGAKAQGQADSINTPDKSGQSPLAQNQKLIEEAEAAVKESQASQINAQANAGKASAAAERKASEDKIRAMEAGLAALESVFGKSTALELDYWSGQVATAQKGSREYLRALESLQHAQAEILTSTANEKKRFADESQKAVGAITEEQSKPNLDGLKEAARATIAWEEAVHAGADIERANSSSIAEASIKAAEASGAMTKLGAAQAIAALHAKDYSDKLAVLQEHLKALQEADYLSPMDKRAQMQTVQNQIGALQGQQAVTAIGDQANISQQLVQPYTTAFNTINDQWLQLQNKLIFGTRHVGAAFANMGVSILESVAANFEKMLVHSAEAELKMLLAHTTANEAKVASDTAAAAQTQTISALSALKEISHAAAVAAAKAYSALAGIPVIGPVLGAVAAAGTFAAVEALAAFETGGIIPNTGVALVHQGEAVLPANLTNLLLGTAGSTSNSNSVSQVNNFSGSSDRAFQRQMMRNANHAVAAVSRGLRNRGSR